MGRFQEIAFTPLVKKHQEEYGSRAQYERLAQNSVRGDELTSSEEYFLAQRDSFYMASVSETGWPYVQHRGGPKGFIRVLGPRLLGFADLRGNKQYISVGNFDHNPRVALFFMDYPNQTRLKILGCVEVHEHDVSSEYFEQFRTNEPGAFIERIILVHVEGFDWNCPQHITPRYTMEELQETLAPVQTKLAELQAENATLRAKLSSKNP